MMGPRQVEQASLFYEFSLERHVPAGHLLCSIDRFVDFSGLRRQLAPFYSTTGRPSVDPELMLRMRLCDEVHLNLAYRWFCRLGLDGDVPDHSTFSKNRHGRFRDSDLLRRLFETVLERCIAENLVGGEGFAVDGSLIKADASRQKGVNAAEWTSPEVPGRAVKEYLAVLDDAAFGTATPVVPKFISPADPASRWTGADGGLATFAKGEPTTVIRLPLPVAAIAKRLADGTLKAGDVADILSVEPRRDSAVPLVLSPASCGFPSPADDYLDRPLDFNELLVTNPSATFAVRIAGDSMRDAGIFPGDFAIVDRSLSPTNGCVVLALLDGEFTIKRYRQTGGRIVLQPENRAYREIEITEESAFEVWGVVKNTIRML